MWRKFAFSQDVIRNSWRTMVWKLQKILRLSPCWPMLSRCYNYFPNYLSDRDWARLLQCETQKERFNHVKFCRQKEIRRLKCEAKKKVRFDEVKMSTRASRFAMFIGTTQQDRINNQQRLMNCIHNFQMDSTPALIVDCRFLSQLSQQALSQTLLQLSYLASENRDRKRSWPLYFFNFDFDNKCILEARDRYLSIVKSSKNTFLTISSSSYLNQFSPKQIIYLSPHATLDLEKVDGTKAYVIGGIVDRVAQHKLDPHASLLAAIEDGVEARRLPLDKYIKWKSGSKSMTLLAVTSILYSVYETDGDWEAAFKKYVPTRNLRGPEEKNKYSQRLHACIHDYERRVLVELNQRLNDI
ncbi:unnamed protein product [Thelazia callipaeda]|uniref:RNA (guanine-9-)-methyltransferase domain-containing protein 1 n=1 Tax=Thelazia callipaeda TaxID=103827 RepID=A0A0N5D0K5_THECL|nr:unnamed protein product [Thelazia callipaeda]